MAVVLEGLMFDQDQDQGHEQDALQWKERLGLGLGRMGRRPESRPWVPRRGGRLVGKAVGVDGVEGWFDQDQDHDQDQDVLQWNERLGLGLGLRLGQTERRPGGEGEVWIPPFDAVAFDIGALRRSTDRPGC